MKKVLIVTVLCMFVASAAFAQGISLGWEDGVSVKAMIDPVCIQGVIGFQSNSPQDSDEDGVFELDIAGYLAYPVIDMGESKMNVFGGAALMISNETIQFGLDEYDKAMDFAIRGGLQHDVMVTDYISVSGKAGLQLYMDGGWSDWDDSGSTTIGTWGTVGIYWWF